MAEKRFDRIRVEEFLRLAGERLDGEWLLIGGGAAAAWFAPRRTTEDLDLFGFGGSNRERLALMELAESCGLPIEAVNSAADYVVQRVPGWRDHLVELHRGSRATIYRPDAVLFLLLKIRRLSEIDLEDCLALIAHCEQTHEELSSALVVSAIEMLPDTDDDHLRARRERLRSRLSGG